MVYLFLAFLFEIACGFIGQSIAKSKGRDPAVWFILCFLTGIIGIAVLAFSSPAAHAGQVEVEEEEAADIPDDVPLSLKLATIAAVEAEERAKRKQVVAAEVPKRSKFEFDENEWDRILAEDPEVSAAADTVRMLGLEHEDELAFLYLKSRDKAKLPEIVAAIRQKVR